MQRKRAETDLSGMLARYGIWRYKLADVAVPFWNKKQKQFGGGGQVAYLQKKPFDFVVGNCNAWGGIECKSGQTSFQFLSLTAGGTLYQIVNKHLFLKGYSDASGHWPEPLESAPHGIQPHQRRALTTLESFKVQAWIALQMGTGPAGSKKKPLRFWLLPFSWWRENVEYRLIDVGCLSLPYDETTTNRVVLKDRGLTACTLLSRWELTWDPAITGANKWTLPMQHSFRNTFGVDLAWTPPPETLGSTQMLSLLTGPTVLPLTSVASSPEMPPSD